MSDVNQRRSDAGFSPLSEQDWNLYVAHARVLAWSKIFHYLPDEEIAEFAVRNVSILELEELFEGQRLRLLAIGKADEVLSSTSESTP